MSKTFVLIHGSWHGGWAWDAVIRELSKRGHCAHAPTLAGHGPGVTRQGINHQDCVISVVNYILQRDLNDLVLVGHSFGRTVFQRAAQELADRIAGIVFIDALVLEDGQCVFDNLPADYVSAFNALAATSRDNTMLIPWEIWRDNFMQDAPESMARSFWEQLSPEPNQVNLDKLDLKAFASLAIPRSFIYSRQDQALPPGYFHPRISSRLFSNCSKWTAGMRLCLRGLPNWPARSSKRAWQRVDKNCGWGDGANLRIMTETQFYVFMAVPLVGILVNGGLFIYLGGRMDRLIEKVGELGSRVAVLEDRAR